MRILIRRKWDTLTLSQKRQRAKRVVKTTHLVLDTLEILLSQGKTVEEAIALVRTFATVENVMRGSVE